VPRAETSLSGVDAGQSPVQVARQCTGKRVIYWFRRDLRLADLPGLRATMDAAVLLPVWVDEARWHQPDRWGIEPLGPHRARFQADAVADLDRSLRALGSRLWAQAGDPVAVVTALVKAASIDVVVTQAEVAPYEQDDVAALRRAGVTVLTVAPTSLFDLSDLPFKPAAVPTVFTPFRHAVEGERTPVHPPMAAPRSLPPLPDIAGLPAPVLPAVASEGGEDPRSSFPYARTGWTGAARDALAHVQRYFAGPLPRQYKATRNGLSGTDFSTKFSPWLATGALSPRQIHAELLAHEQREGESDGSRWIVFELLWREHFRLLYHRFGRKLYRGRGLTDQPAPGHNPQGFARWQTGRTGVPLVDAAMRELSATGFMSNRLRQLVASYLIHDLGGDWRAGAAWFEHLLVDHDVHSNHGNWLYISGRGTDPRGGRRFNPEKQSREHDPDGAFVKRWTGR